jgi:protease I
MAQLKDFRVAALVTDGFEESELLEPLKALQDEQVHVTIFAPKKGKVQGFRHLDKGTPVQADKDLAELQPDEFDALLLPGGAINADALRVVPEVQTFLRAMQDAGKPMAVICHAPWELVSAGLVRGRTLTSYYTIQDDIRNAGGNWLDREVVKDDNWVTSRQPKDIPAFNRAMIELFAGSLATTPH